MAEKEKRRISPAVIVPVAIAGVAALGGIIYVATRGKAPPTVYTCPYCGQIFLRPDLLEAHIYWHHPEEEPVEPEPEPAPPIEEPVTLSNLVVPTEPIPIGKPVYITVDATNPNDTQVVATIVLGGDFSEIRDVVLDPNSTTTISFLITLETSGTYLVRVNGLEAYITSEILEVELSNLVASPQVVTVGEKVTITVDVANPNWETSLTYLVRLTGAIQAEQEVTLAPHETQGVVFVETVTWEGYQDVYCDGLSVLIKGEIYVPPEEEPPPGAFICPICGYKGDSDAEVGHHAAEAHYGYTYPAGTINADSFGGMGGKLVLYDIIDPNPELFARARWAMDNIVSGEYLWKNLGSSERDSLWTYLREVLGITNINDLFRSYGTAYWQAYIRIDEIAPGWSEWLLPPEEEAPPHETELEHRFSAWPADKPLPDCLLGISGWEISDPTPYQVGTRWYITIHAYYYVWSDTGELVYPCTVSPPDCEWVVSGFEVGTPLYKDSTDMGTVTLIENLGGGLRRVTAGGSTYYFIRMMTSVGYGFAWCDQGGEPYLK